jgi:uncharacterized protein YutE (UPF0331/DUF86 family)
MQNDVILNKASIISRCVKRISDEYAGIPENLYNITKQDSITLNVQRACEACIDLAMHIISEKNLGIPQSSKDAFELLVQNNIINPKMAFKLKAMVGFRNIAVHDYQTLNIEILNKIIENHLGDFQDFSNLILTLE